MKSGKLRRAVEILLVEDNPADVRLTVEAFKEGTVRHKLSVARDGVEALDILFRRGIHNQAVRPDIILLDLNLPRKDGREVLQTIKVDQTLRRIPVVVLTTSSAEEDILRSYDLHVNCYITKPVDMERFIEVVRAIENFWFNIVQLPAT
ncbi:MAG: response regulator [Proteobacteria bacterium]|nr:response regulator [Pseudomonadota bacterium]